MTIQSLNKARLPVGIEDRLINTTRKEKYIISNSLKRFASFGYEEINPPLLELGEEFFKSSKKLKNKSFQFMDPSSNEILIIRPDITSQISRIATSRLKNKPRPLRVCYSGDILYCKSSSFFSRRQFTQIGLELIGSRQVNADLEIIKILIDTLMALGFNDLTLDISCVPILHGVFQQLKFSDATVRAIIPLINQKDMNKIAEFLADEEQKVKDVIYDLLNISNQNGNIAKNLNNFIEKHFASNDKLQKHIMVIDALYEAVDASYDNLNINIDVSEDSGLGYYSGVSFSILDNKNVIDLAKGGRYRLENDEPAVGASMFLHNILSTTLDVKRAKRIFLPYAESEAVAKEYRNKGWVTIRSLDENIKDNEQEAIRLNCDYWSDRTMLREIGHRFEDKDKKK